MGELSRHFRVDGDHHVLLALHELVARLDLLSYPVAEGLADHGRADIDDPLLGHLLEVWLVWKVVCDVGLLHDEVTDVLQGQVLVARHVDRLDLVIR